MTQGLAAYLPPYLAILRFSMCFVAFLSDFSTQLSTICILIGRLYLFIYFFSGLKTKRKTLGGKVMPLVEASDEAALYRFWADSAGPGVLWLVRNAPSRERRMEPKGLGSVRAAGTSPSHQGGPDLPSWLPQPLQPGPPFLTAPHLPTLVAQAGLFPNISSLFYSHSEQS